RIYNGQSVTGLIAKSSHTFMGCYYFTGEFYTKWRRELIVTFLLLSILAFVALIASNLFGETSKLQIRQRLKQGLFHRFVAVIAMVGILNASNCTGGKNDPSFSNPAYGYGAIDNLYMGLPAGTVWYHMNHLGSSTLITDTNGLE